MNKLPRQPDDMDDEDPRHRIGRLILALRSQGVIDPKVLDAIEATPRELFVPELFQDRSWEDSALPIACGQTISQPFIVGLMTQALEVEPRHRVLEIGTGSGYQTAVLARLSRYVYTVERYRTLLAEAEGRLKELDLLNVITRFGDGGEGWPEQAPFDRIMVTAAAPSEPRRLISQLKPTGILVAPVGRGAVQSLVRYVGDGAGSFRRESLGEVRFVPLVEGVAREL
jgi:protein-L-isoaspartate(D-aspartate) O-methyltransferase